MSLPRKKGWLAVVLLALWLAWDNFGKPLWTLNLERWAEGQHLDSQLRDKISPTFWEDVMSWLADAVIYLTGPFGLGFALGALLFAFWDPIRHLVGRNDAALLKQQRLAKKEDRAGQAREESERKRAALIALDNLFAEGVKERNRLIPTLGNYDNDKERPKVTEWTKRVLEQMDKAGVGVSVRSRFRTFDRFFPNYTFDHLKTAAQSTLEGIWNKKLNQLREIIDSLDADETSSPKSHVTLSPEGIEAETQQKTRPD